MLTDLVRSAPVSSIDEVLAIMTAIDTRLPDTDGVKWFNRLYLQVTRSVRQAVSGPAFRDARFMSELDVVFANLYFEAIAAGESDVSRAPSAWRPLLRARSSRGIGRLQFALAGMNAHINRDLPAGIVAAYVATDGAPGPCGARRDDFVKVNDLLEAVEAQIKVEFSTGIVALVDSAAGDVDDIVAMWNVRAAREAAWTNAEVLWTLRPSPALHDAFFARLDRFTGFAGRGLLLPGAQLTVR
jgi:hypothetical protein